MERLKIGIILTQEYRRPGGEIEDILSSKELKVEDFGFLAIGFRVQILGR